MITMVKFITNKKVPRSNDNPLITKTLGKTGVLSREHMAKLTEVPKEEEFWYVEILKEKGAGTPNGPFILRPIEKVPNSANNNPGIVHMIPGTYKIEQIDNTILLHPNELWYPDRLGPHWICGLNIKKNLMNKYRLGDKFMVNSVIVVFDRTHSWDRETVQNEPSGSRVTRTAAPFA